MPRRPTKQDERAEKQRLASKNEEDIQKALKGLKQRTVKNVSQAARQFGVCRDTLRRRQQVLNGPSSKAQERRQLLTEAQEQALCEWIIHLAEMGEPLSKQALRAHVADLSECLREKTRRTGQKQLPSRNWVYVFLVRNPQLVLR